MPFCIRKISNVRRLQHRLRLSGHCGRAARLADPAGSPGYLAVDPGGGYAVAGTSLTAAGGAPLWLGAERVALLLVQAKWGACAMAVHISAGHAAPRPSPARMPQGLVLCNSHSLAHRGNLDSKRCPGRCLMSCCVGRGPAGVARVCAVLDADSPRRGRHLPGRQRRHQPQARRLLPVAPAQRRGLRRARGRARRRPGRGPGRCGARRAAHGGWGPLLAACDEMLEVASMALILWGTTFHNIVRAYLLSTPLSSLLVVSGRHHPAAVTSRVTQQRRRFRFSVRRRKRPVRAGAAAGRGDVHERAHQPGGRPAGGRVRRRLRARGLRACLPVRGDPRASAACGRTLQGCVETTAVCAACFACCHPRMPSHDALAASQIGIENSVHAYASAPFLHRSHARQPLLLRMLLRPLLRQVDGPAAITGFAVMDPSSADPAPTAWALHYQVGATVRRPTAEPSALGCACRGCRIALTSPCNTNQGSRIAVQSQARHAWPHRAPRARRLPRRARR